MQILFVLSLLFVVCGIIGIVIACLLKDKKWTPKVGKTIWWRVPFIPIYFGIGLFIMSLIWEDLFYIAPNPQKVFGDWRRLMGCVACGCFGFGYIVTKVIKHRNLEFPWTYVYHYPLIIILGSSITFGIFQSIEQTRGYLFYFFAFPISFLIGFLSDYFVEIILRVLHRSSGVSIE